MLSHVDAPSLTDLQLHRRYLILGVKRMTLEWIYGVFLTLRQCPRSHIYTVVALVPFDAQTMREINSRMSVANVAYVGLDAAYVIGVAFHILY